MLFLKTILYYPLLNALILLVFFMPNHNVGLAIVALTVIVRLILLPSSLKSIHQMKKLQELQPELQKIQEANKDDKQKQSTELMEFYKKNNINPLGSCFIQLVQLPILIVLYYVFVNGLDMSRFSLLYSWVPQPDFMNTMFLGIDIAKPDKWVLPIIAGLTQFYQMYQITPKVQPKAGQEMQGMMQKQMMYIFPLMTVFIAGRFAAALPIYWIVTTLFAIGQQWWIYKDHKKEPLTVAVSKSSYVTTLPKEQKIIKKGVELTIRRKNG